MPSLRASPGVVQDFVSAGVDVAGDERVQRFLSGHALALKLKGEPSWWRRRCVFCAAQPRGPRARGAF